MALESDRVNVREGLCPVLGCQKETKRLDRHLHGHTELTVKARRVAFNACKHEKILRNLAILRSSNPEVPMVSTLDLYKDNGGGDATQPGDVEEEVNCSSEVCRRQEKRLRNQVADLNKQVDTLSSTLQELTRFILTRTMQDARCRRS
ncbi:MAG: hypothetical protein ACRDDA_08295 [Aeromonas sp.]